MAVSMLNYSCENLGGGGEIKSAQMKLLWSVAWFTFLDFKRNTGIPYHINTFNANDKTENQKEIGTNTFSPFEIQGCFK
jgi:hypothetical protein